MSDSTFDPDAGEELAVSRTQAGQPPVQEATTRDRGIGPFARLVLRGATVIDGTGAPPIGPIDIVITDGRITELRKVGAAKMPIKPERRPAAGDHEIDCHGKWVTPGFIDCHAHAGVPYHAANGWVPPVDYVYKLWLAHGVTTVREMGSMNGLSWTLRQKEFSAANTIAAPHIVAHTYFPAVNDMLKIIHTPEQGRAWLRRVKERGADGIKFFGAPPAIMEAALDECRKLGLRSGCHHAQMAVTRMNALTSARWGLTSAEHYYGLPEALFEHRVVQDYPTDYDYNDEYFRFAYAGQTFSQGAEPGSVKWREVMDAFLELDFTFVPTFGIYDANRDLMRARQADWHHDYAWKSLWKYFQPQRGGHGSYWVRWTTTNEIEWKQNYRIWMQFINEYKNRGGRVCAGSDSGFIYQIFGFGFVRELEMLQEAGFHPLEVLRTATVQGADLLGIGGETGSVEVGKRADLLVHDENPLTDFKLLYGTGALRLNDATNTAEWHRALRHTIKAGMVFDVGELLSDVRALVERSYAEDESSGEGRGGAATGAEKILIAPLDFVVLTGFLGSGKTTLLRDFLAMPEAADTAVIVNEVGEIGLDGAILAEGAGGLRMAMLANGCVCCALGGDLAATVEQLIASREAPLRRVVLETSGLSKPGPILRALASLAPLPLRINVVATFDCLRGAETTEFDEAVAQWAGAQALVLTKRDRATPAQRGAARAAARGTNPLADIIDMDDRAKCVAAVFGPRPPAPPVVPEIPGPPHPRVTVLLLRPTGKLAWDDVAAWLDNLAGLLGERLLRVKGVVSVAESERPMLVQSVGTMFSAPRPFGGPVAEPFLVVIARDVSPGKISRITPSLPIAVSRIGTPDTIRATGARAVASIVT